MRRSDLANSWRDLSTVADGSMGKPEPPSGPPWDLPLAEAPLAFIDLEMTGLDVERDRVVQVCVERVVGGEVRAALCRIVDPTVPLGNSTRFHGIGPDEIATAEPFSSVADEVLSLLDGACLVAHGAKWDVGFLSAELTRLGRTWHCPHFLDTLALARRQVDAPRHGLIPLAAHLGIDNPRPHRADNDVRVTRDLFAHLEGLFRQTRGDARATLRDLWRLSAGRRVVEPAMLAEVKEAVASEGRAEVLYRSANRRAPQRFTFRATRLRSDLDPPVVLGYLQRTRGRRELRLDRILEFRLLQSEEPSPDDEPNTTS